MLERDYLTEIIGEFVQTVVRALEGDALVRDSQASIDEIEAAVASLTDMEPEVALALAPESFAMMLSISGVGDELSSYVPYALNAVADIYEKQGQPDVAELRREQGKACAVVAGVPDDYVPVEFH